MPEQVLRAPGYFDREIDLSVREVQPSGVPATVIGASLKGPAFVPTTLGSYLDFSARFGDVDPKLQAGYAIQKFLEPKQAAVFIRTLGAGANAVSADFETTRLQGTVVSAGMKITGSNVLTGTDNRFKGAVQFLVAKHKVASAEAYAFPMFSDNDSFTLASSNAYLTRAMLMTATDTRVMIFHPSESFSTSLDDVTTIDDSAATSVTYRKFKLAISSSAGASFAADDGFAGVRIYTASMDPSDDAYIGKLLNTDPERFETEKHCLYADFAVDAELAPVASGSNGETVAIFSGSINTSTTSGDTALPFRDAFGRFDTRFKTPQTPMFISQPFGTAEYDLFTVESLDDGAYANSKYKISIAGLKASNDPRNDYGTFTLIVRAWDDTDFDPKIIEQYNNLTLDSNSDNYIGRVIGNKKVSYLFDAESEDDRRIKVTGEYANRSKLIRVNVSADVANKIVPAKALPFGFRGIEALNTNLLLTDTTPPAASARLAGSGSAFDPRLSGSIVPPVPYRFKVTRGVITSSANFTGEPGSSEVTDSRLYWGVKFERNTSPTNTNVVNTPNALLAAYTKFLGLKQLDVVVTGSSTDTFNNNKFTLARVALSNGALTDVTASANTHMREAAYMRNGRPDGTNYLISDGAFGNRITLASLLSKDTASNFNKFSEFAKFTTFMYGGWDGVNILDKNAARFNDKSTSAESGGLANASYTSPGAASGTNWSGTGVNNNSVRSYRVAVDIATDAFSGGGSNLIVLPGQRDTLITDYTTKKASDNGLMFYIMDIPYYDSDVTRIFDGDAGRFVDVEVTANQFDARAIDNNTAAAYFPNFVMDDTVNNRRVVLPASVAALAAFGFNDKVAYPWFAPAGFNRGALGFVTSTQVKVNQRERNSLYDARINPIVKFPNDGYVFFSQRTLQQAKTFLESINVKRMLLEIKRSLVEIGNRIIWENISPRLREQYKRDASSVLSSVQLRKGIEAFKVVCDSTNNTDLDVDNLLIRAQIRVLPTRAIEYVVMDFNVTPSGTVIA
jgi:hypothetical protein